MNCAARTNSIFVARPSAPDARPLRPAPRGSGVAALLGCIALLSACGDSSSYAYPVLGSDFPSAASAASAVPPVRSSTSPTQER